MKDVGDIPSSIVSQQISLMGSVSKLISLAVVSYLHFAYFSLRVCLFIRTIGSQKLHRHTYIFGVLKQYYQYVLLNFKIFFELSLIKFELPNPRDQVRVIKLHEIPSFFFN